MPDTREKLIELLEGAESAIYWDGSDRGFIEKIADHLIANGVTVQKWISVTERLPETGTRIIVCRKGGKVEQGVYLGVNGWWRVYGANTKAVTHWMLMPDPVKEV